MSTKSIIILMAVLVTVLACSALSASAATVSPTPKPLTPVPWVTHVQTHGVYNFWPKVVSIPGCSEEVIAYPYTMEPTSFTVTWSENRSNGPFHTVEVPGSSTSDIKIMFQGKAVPMGHIVADAFEKWTSFDQDAGTAPGGHQIDQGAMSNEVLLFGADGKPTTPYLPWLALCLGAY